MRRTKVTTTLRKNRRRSRDGVAIEVESYGAVEIGAVNADSGSLEARENGGRGGAGRRSGYHRGNGEGRVLGGPEFLGPGMWSCRGGLPFKDPQGVGGGPRG